MLLINKNQINRLNKNDIIDSSNSIYCLYNSFL